MANARTNIARVGAPGAYSPHRTRTSGDISHYAPPNIKLGGPQGDDLETLIRHYDSLLELRDSQIMQLTSQLESEQRRASMLESELGLALAASSRAESAHAAELSKVEGDVARVLAERRGLLEKLQGIEVVEDAVREMVVQMKPQYPQYRSCAAYFIYLMRAKFRVGDDERPSPEQLQAEKAALRDENILTVLGTLKATLKTLWNFKVEAEEDMRCSRLGRQSTHTQQESAGREALLCEGRQVLAAMEGKQREVLEALRAAEEEAAAARRALEVAQEEGRRRDGLVLKNQQLESARHFDRVAQRSITRGSQFDATSLYSSPSFAGGRPASAVAGGGGGRGGPGSVAGSRGGVRPRLGSALAVMASRRAHEAAKAQEEAEVLESQDPVYKTLVNVNKLHRGIRSQIREVKRELSESQPSWAGRARQQATATAGAGAGAGPGAGAAQQPQQQLQQPQQQAGRV
ncbi:hypothetical protein VOLCADRAFT_93044 [Volvox carteri f. nagariensis]|uniref:Uncharacterized protein n=1 Tax=Volvox carteri f. nagariensis TaxID=3068 RepID=D8U171_VOLCA|nr:uncharacterized protein VOLCADRAFT_93044 [Volvox carteri f. nagariensis]EFJ46583.1 hypothetical protein VOLCADRAFT_93044 [Volvox carteri f. nagariensis]|eukprot:XP_002952440.1 hypothetical protein VOLCADRAFT_93044 [Volvox carteri f. nagariensis]